uniref:BHLH domain-containing protein n=1 Tax=Caenorhabditis tropicalis TaxID=1561998 RepID=A0A1I7TH32_9PELO
MFHVQMEIHSFNSDLDIKKVGLATPTVAEPSSNGEKKIIDRALEEKRKRFQRRHSAYIFNSDLDIKKVGLATPTVAEPSSNGEKKLMTLEERRKCLQRRHTTYM